jgi:hypothetical protein
VAKCCKVNEQMIITAISIFAFLLAVVAIDEMLEHKPVLGEEWDFTRINFTPRSIDRNK